MEKRRIRKIRFGIRFKFTLIMIIGITFVSALIGLAVFNQHEKKIKDTMLRLGSTIIKGTSDDVQKYLSIRNILNSIEAKEYSIDQLAHLNKEQEKSYKAITKYFSSVVKKEKLLDIAFLIEINWQDVFVDWKKADQSKYYYFNRNDGNLFIQKSGMGRKDLLLEPTIFSHYMQNIDVDTFLILTDFLEAKEYQFLFQKIRKNYIIVGLPLFNDRADSSFYECYLTFKKSSLSSEPSKLMYLYNEKKYILKSIHSAVAITTKDRILAYNGLKNDFKERFIDKIIRNGMSLDYSLHLDTNNKKKAIFYYFNNKYNISHLNAAQRRSLADKFNSNLDEKMRNNMIRLSAVKDIWKSIMKEYSIDLVLEQEEGKLWKSFYEFIKRNKIDISTSYSLDELALISFRKDLSGILGLFLQRYYYFYEMEENRNEIINLTISILIRAIFIAIFFPTFLIQAVSRLADGALEIGKGNLNKQIELKGSDELGRLADILNVMTLNLKIAQNEMLEKQRMENELITAQQIQEALLPRQLPDIKGIEFGTYYSAQSEAGGDYYDIIELDKDNIGITIADVSGHGVGSGLVMAMTRTLLHTYCKKTENPKKIFEIINEYLYENTASNYFVSMFYGILKLKGLTLTYSSAGHNQGILLRQEIKELPGGGIALGATANTTFSRLIDIKEVKLQRDDYFIQFTDGVVEAKDKNNNEFGNERFQKALMANYGKHPQKMIESVMDLLNKFTGKIPQNDDITMIIMRIK